MPRLNRGIVLLYDQVWMAGAPIAARLSCWTSLFGSYLQNLSPGFSLPKAAQLSRAKTPKRLPISILCMTKDLKRSVSWKSKCPKMKHMRGGVGILRLFGAVLHFSCVFSHVCAITCSILLLQYMNRTP
jgi:hypothetical protein